MIEAISFARGIARGKESKEILLGKSRGRGGGGGEVGSTGTQVYICARDTEEEIGREAYLYYVACSFVLALVEEFVYQ